MEAQDNEKRAKLATDAERATNARLEKMLKEKDALLQRYGIKNPTPE